MEILVCIKQVPDPEHFDQVRLDPVTRNIIREGIPAIINPLDRHALEEALRLREKHDARVTVVSMGPPPAAQALQEALAMGADRACLLCDRAFSGADTLATAVTLAAAARKLGKFDLILCGNETVDGGTAQVPAQLAELLDLPCATGVVRLEIADGAARVERVFERGRLKMALDLPCLVAVRREINQPRLPTVLGIIQAAGKELVTWSQADLGLAPEQVGLEGSPIRVADVLTLASGRRREVFTGPPREAVKQAVRRLVELEAL